MREPNRLSWVIVLLDALDTCVVGLTRLGQCFAHRAVRATRSLYHPPGEVMPSLIRQRIRQTKAPPPTVSIRW